MSSFASKDPDFDRRVRTSFANQPAMETIGTRIESVEPGKVVIAMDHNESLTQQHGFIHAGIISTALDSACGYAGLTLMPPGAAVLTVEFKTNLLAPAKGESYRMKGQVIKPGRTLMVVEGRAYAINGGEKKLITTMTATIMVIEGRSGLKD